jgi:hypothetical protein
VTPFTAAFGSRRFRVVNTSATLIVSRAYARALSRSAEAFNVVGINFARCAAGVETDVSRHPSMDDLADRGNELVALPQAQEAG